jgi:2-oxoglutarate dehydrogenase E1 component
MHDFNLSGDAASSLARLSGASSPSNPQARGGLAHIGNAALLESTYEQWRIAPDTVDPSWRAFFEGFELGLQQEPHLDGPTAPTTSTTPTSSERTYRLKQARIYNLLFAYRTLGHHLASLDPLELAKPVETELDLKHFKLDESDLDTVFDSGQLAGGGERTLREILSILKNTYCGTIGVEYMHIQNFKFRRWIRDKIELTQNRPQFSAQAKRRILNRILAAELFEKFLHTRYVGQKRFGLEGGETLIPMLDAVVQRAPKLGVERIVMGMAHRGRLNVLANILNKSYKSLFSGFAENYVPDSVQGDGDVKYHLGYEANVTTPSGEKVGISLAPNPSHLEAVNPVVLGKARAWQRILNDTEERTKVLPILIHGDAAVIGQGIVQETLNLAQLEGYRTGGTIHIVINNQIGFTTVPKDARSPIYCTSIAKMNGIPIFHVNGDDPIAAVHVMEMAFEYRQTFKRDIFIDLCCYRRHGHNEGDEPNFTQPTLYQEIDAHPRISEILIPKLIAAGDITQERAQQYVQKFQDQFEAALNEAKAATREIKPRIKPPISCPELLDPVDTPVPLDRLQRVGRAISEEPPSFKLNPKLAKLLQARRAMADGKEPIDWPFAELLAFGTLLDEQIPVRLSGQDVRRGTFSQRHAVLYDVTTRDRYIPLMNISPNQARICIYNSPLSEAGVLGFDFGYSLDYPNMLCIWEAQFGDFANGAQVMIDQFITSSESKWGVTSGIVLMLPHGYHGQGPEHSSARLERFLQLCAEDNIQVANATTAANHFHILRRQVLRKFRKPLILMTPKGMLRDKRMASPLEAFTSSRFQEILPDPAAPPRASRLILCSGKVYYDLEAYRAAHKIEDVAIVRIEQLYPLHTEKLRAATDPYRDAKIVWCQEESQNMGAWSFIEPRLRALFGKDITYAGRDASASPATGSLAIHELEQQDVVRQAFEN